jgi:hypothetical protein
MSAWHSEVMMIAVNAKREKLVNLSSSLGVTAEF